MSESKSAGEGEEDGGSLNPSPTQQQDTKDESPVPFDQDGWVAFIDDEDSEIRWTNLGNLRILLSKTMMMKDFDRHYKERTLTVSPVAFDDILLGVYSDFFEKCLSFTTSFGVVGGTVTQNNYVGILYLHYKTPEILEEEMTKLQNLKKDLKISALGNMRSDTRDESIQSNANIFENDAKKAGVKPGRNDNSVASISAGMPLFKEATSLFTTTISKDVTEDTVWEMFPLAHFIMLFKEPFTRMYVMFTDENTMLESVQAIKAMTPKLPPFQLTRLSDARDAFFKFAPRRGKLKKGQTNPQKAGAGSKGADKAGKPKAEQKQAGSGGVKNAPSGDQSASVGLSEASIAESQVQAPKPGAGGKKRKKAGSQNQVQESESAGAEATVAKATVAEATAAPVTSTPATDSDQPVLTLSKGQLKRLKKRQKKEAEMGITPNVGMTNPVQTKKPKSAGLLPTPMPPQQPDFTAGLALLQTLTNIAQNMSTVGNQPLQMPPQNQRSKNKGFNNASGFNQGQRQGQKAQKRSLPAPEFSSPNRGPVWKSHDPQENTPKRKKKKNKSLLNPDYMSSSQAGTSSYDSLQLPKAGGFGSSQGTSLYGMNMGSTGYSSSSYNSSSMSSALYGTQSSTSNTNTGNSVYGTQNSGGTTGSSLGYGGQGVMNMGQSGQSYGYSSQSYQY